MAQRKRNTKPLRRQAGNRRERKTVIVFCEGKLSEPDYIKGLKALPHVEQNTAVDIVIDSGQGVPLVLVERAIARKQDSEIDECWCVFDVEWPQNHPHLNKALELAQNNEIRLAISNPCFELWLILHYKDYGAFAETAAAERDSRLLDSRSGKGIDASVYMPRRKDAARRARALEKRHAKDSTFFPHNNPSTTMYELLEAIEN